jgi:6-phosphogluconolactonase
VLARAAADRWVGPAATGFHHVALSGGRIARQFLAVAREIADTDASAARKLQTTHFFWSDERCVAAEHPESNYRLAREALLDPVEVPGALVHRLKGEEDPDGAVQDANEEIARFVPQSSVGLPIFDLVFLGMGEDGHVASLFPGGPVSTQQPGPAYAVVVGPKPPNPRITLTYPALAVAREVWVLVSGEGKELSLRNSLEGKVMTPLARLIQLRESTRVLVDRFF